MNVYGPTPPVTERLRLYGSPSPPFGAEAGTIAGAGLTVTVALPEEVPLPFASEIEVTV